jgi:hypothetical protein
MRFNVCDDISDLTAKWVNDIPSLKQLFCVNSAFKQSCKQKIMTMNRDLESKLREEIRFLLTPKAGSYSETVLKTALYREYLLNSKRTVLQVAYEQETKSSLDFRALKLKTKMNPKSDSAYILYSSIWTGNQQSC